MKNIVNFINSIDNKSINRIRDSKSDAEFRRFLKELYNDYSGKKTDEIIVSKKEASNNTEYFKKPFYFTAKGSSSNEIKNVSDLGRLSQLVQIKGSVYNGQDIEIDDLLLIRLYLKKYNNNNSEFFFYCNPSLYNKIFSLIEINPFLIKKIESENTLIIESLSFFMIKKEGIDYGLITPKLKNINPYSCMLFTPGK